MTLLRIGDYLLNERHFIGIHLEYSKYGRSLDKKKCTIMALWKDGQQEIGCYSYKKSTDEIHSRALKKAIDSMYVI